MWANHYRYCARCKSTKHKHRARGLCELCYQKFLYHANENYRIKTIARTRRWQDKNREKVLKRMREYGKKYYKSKKYE